MGSDGVFSMLLTKCASCAAPLGLTSGKKCGRCATRYCGPACQKKHWEEGGHDQLCKKIKRYGGAEQFYANTKYTEAVAVAVEACRGRHEGQKCYICLEAVHPRTGEGLVRGCACGDRDGVSSPELGVAHVTCLARQAKELVEEADENKFGREAWYHRWERWFRCSLCERQYHGHVYCALGWACWKTYVGRPDVDVARMSAMRQLGNGLSSAGHHEDALSVYEAELSLTRHLGGSEEDILIVQSNIASLYIDIGRRKQALVMRRDVYSGYLKLLGEEHGTTLMVSYNYADSLVNLKHFEEAKPLLHKIMPLAQRVLGESHDTTLRMKWTYADALYTDPSATIDDLREAVATLEETARTAGRVLGGAHPLTEGIEESLWESRAVEARREAMLADGGVSFIREAIEAMTSGTA